MRKLSCIVFVFITLVGCKKKEANDLGSEFEELVFNYQKIPKRAAINPKATAITDDWPAFRALSGSFDVLYKATNNEDLILAIDDLIDKENLLAKSEYPEEFNELQVKGRQRVLKTYLLKVKASILNNAETTQPTIEMIQAYNALRTQLNVIVNSQLDKTLILNEE